MILTTKPQRIFFVFLVGLLAGSLLIAFLQLKLIIEPTRWYFFTTDGSGIDIQSPTGKLIIDADIFPEFGWPANDEMRRRLKERCDYVSRVNVQNPVGAKYRDVELCNTINATGKEFDSRNVYFRSRVDDLYRRYYQELTAHFASFLAPAVAIWLAALASWSVIGWIRRGK